ncbi:hypothetical protein DFP72DRAFT_1077655 [Ephemerocybe angulata]|uniref:Uncharacterized protein n=1 Tax=Ephemerocybe angulata TaxID=980116 RepID=A0A8H6H8E3_9AGAR|nr:hypothetical protein DFP72DRAFT_1084608 [Tulosesus angulatus]KAF6743616.1 hypothetical protein DFP72DRAFT_1079900 [Tulosesus angulatus]KAF6745342.1 hypothetical protein DFP72DRAFT_1077655 [Tulosesus angulatus]
MPYIGISGALLRLYYTLPSVNAPWCWDRWKDITDVRSGLFPEEDANLPPGLTRSDAAAIRLYFEAYAALSTDSEREVFLRKEYLPGSAIWETWVTTMWSHQKIAAIIEVSLGAVHCLPFQVVQAENLLTLPTDLPVHRACDEIAGVLFGAQGLHNGRVKPLLRGTVMAIASCTSRNLLCSAKRIVKRAEKTELAINKVLEDLVGGSPTETATANFVNLLHDWRKDIKCWGAKDKLKRLAQFEAELTAIREGLGGIPPQPQLLLAKWSTRINPYDFRRLAKQESVDDLLDLLKYYFEPSARSRSSTPVLLEPVQ